MGFGSEELDGDDADADAVAVAADDAVDASAELASASLSILDASGTQSPESTHRFKWYFASSSGILLIVSWSNAMSRLSKHFCNDWKYEQKKSS